MNEVIKQLKSRKSVRVFEKKPISSSDKAAIIDSAFQAPTAGNMMLYSIIDVTDQALKERLAVTCDNQPFIATAPLVLVFFADYQKWIDSFKIVGETLRHPGEGDLLLAVSDTLIAAQNTVVCAESLGIGSCYIGDIMEHFELHKELFDLPQFSVPVGMICYGYPTKQQQVRKKPTRFEHEYVVYENKYNHLDESKLREMFTKQSGKDGESLDKYLQAFCTRKYNSDFSVEMTRSVKEMIKSWTNKF